MAIDANILLRGIVPDSTAAASQGFQFGQNIKNAPILNQLNRQKVRQGEQSLAQGDQVINQGNREGLNRTADMLHGLFPQGVTPEAFESLPQDIKSKLQASPLTMESASQLAKLGAQRAQGQKKEGFASAKTKVYQNGTVVTVLPDKTVEVTDPSGVVVTDPALRQKTLEDANANEIKFASDRARGISAGGVLGEGDTSTTAAATQEEIVRAEALGRAAIKESEKAFDSAANLEGKINIYDEAITALKGGANPGFINSFLPSFKKETLQLQEAIRKAGLNTISGVTLGAISKSELDLALGVDINEKMNNADLLEHLQSKKAAQKKVAEELRRYATFLADGGTRAKWNKKQSNLGHKGVRLDKNTIPDAPEPEDTTGTFKSQGGITFTVE